MEEKTLSPIILKLPSLFLFFWFWQAPINIAKFLFQLIGAAEHLFSLTLILKTFFRPWKNETRKGYILYAIGIAIAVRVLLLVMGASVLLAVLFLGIVIILFWIIFPLLAIVLIFYPGIFSGIF